METRPTIKNEVKSEVMVSIEKLSMIFSSTTEVTRQTKPLIKATMHYF
jgi:hypothetical protein